MKCETLDNSNFLLYAAKHYDNPQCFDTKEFYDDLKRFKIDYQSSSSSLQFIWYRTYYAYAVLVFKTPS